MAEILPVSTTDQAAGAPILRIALVNNMADAALAITERRFQRLFQAACPQTRLEFRCTTLPAIPRGEMAAARIARHYIALDELQASPTDAIIFSGAEPIQDSLRDEIFWPGLTKLFDWVQAENLPTLFSCLAAHAAVLHFSGIERRRLRQKTFGMFMQTIVSDHPLLGGMPENVSVAHSRWNDVGAEDLAAKNYQVLTANPAIGVDMFVPTDGAPQVFLQGHPEYEESALIGEYNRDLKRYEAGQSSYKPAQPRKEGCGRSALEGSAPPVNSLGFESVIRNWIERKKEMGA